MNQNRKEKSVGLILNAMCLLADICVTHGGGGGWCKGSCREQTACGVRQSHHHRVPHQVRVRLVVGPVRRLKPHPKRPNIQPMTCAFGYDPHTPAQEKCGDQCPQQQETVCTKERPVPQTSGFIRAILVCIDEALRQVSIQARVRLTKDVQNFGYHRGCASGMPCTPTARRWNIMPYNKKRLFNSAWN